MGRRNQVGQCIRFDPDVWARVHVEAEERGLSVNHFITKLVAEGLDRLIPVDEFSLTRKPPVRKLVDSPRA